MDPDPYHLGSWSRILIQRYQMKEKAEFNQQSVGVFSCREIIFFKSETKRVSIL